MNRRFFLSASTAALAASSSVAIAEESKAGKTLLDYSADCTKKGELCLQHCVESLSTGNKSMAACAASVREMLTYCHALTEGVARKSKHVKALAKIALETCKDCETECRKHKNMEVCLQCAESCAACAKECQSVGGGAATG
ncbi:MAG: four-helix bundle copper-binding protein [Bdellovibrio sp.]|nr:MAG: four-helix bundle copper-binding protein [Bdellovibrio sp.]